MGVGKVRTRSGFDTDTAAPHVTSTCKVIAVAAFSLLRDLLLLLFYALPGTPQNCRLYALMALRLAIYVAEGISFYALILTIVVGEDETDPGILVELTRLLLCHATERASLTTRKRRAVPLLHDSTADLRPTWLALLADVNASFPELSQVISNLTSQDYPQDWDEDHLEHLNNTTTFPNASDTTVDLLPSSSPDPPSPTWTSATTTRNPTWTLSPTPDFSSSTLATTSFSPLDITTSSSPLDITASTWINRGWSGYHTSWCLKVQEIQNHHITFNCSASLMEPLAVLLLLIIICSAVSAVVGYLCGKVQAKAQVAASG